MPRREIIGFTVFFLIAFGIPWVGWIVIKNEWLNLWMFPLFCSIAGFAAAYAEGGIDGLRSFCQRTLQLCGAIKWIFLAVLIPLTLGFLFLIFTGVPLSSLHFSIEAILGLSLLSALVTGPLAEEFGWRGYLQNKLLGHMRPIWAVLIVAALWCVWHVPLFYSSVFSSHQSTLRFFTYLLIWSIMMMYLVHRAKGSVWPAVFFHWSANTHADILRVNFPSVDGSLLPGGSKSTFFYLAAAVVFALICWRFFIHRCASSDTIIVNS